MFMSIDCSKIRS